MRFWMIFVLSFFGAQIACAAEVTLRIGYLKVEVAEPPTLSNLDPVADDLGVAGARVGLSDNNTTGKFLGQTYELDVRTVPLGGDPASAVRELLASSAFMLIDAPADALLQIADMPEAGGALLFNVAAEDMHLRDVACRANILHTASSYAMRTDALAQLFVAKRWDDLVMVEGTYPADQAYAEAMKRSIAKFGLRLSDTKTWAFDSDMRRNAAQEVPLFTQDFGDYDAMIVVDEVGDFGRYILYNTWQARPVTGSEGLTAVGWSAVIEQWGAAQLQSRFEDESARDMQPKDYAAWAAVRSLGEAVTRTGSAEAGVLRTYIFSDSFELAGFKGRPLTYRPWNGQLRQPIAVAHPRALVAQAPLDGFLHRVNELDTLGLDAPESQCEAFE